MAFLKTLIFTLVAMLLPSSGADAAPDKEYQVKAAYLFNFTKFVEWPDPEQHIKICTVGGNPFGDTLKVIDKEKVGSKEVQVATISEAGLKNASKCNIVFVSGSNFRSVLASTVSSPVLTVSDESGFADKGGMIEFVKYEGKIKLIINQKAIADSGLKIDPSLLEVAWKVVE